MDDEAAPELADLNDGKNCFSCRNSGSISPPTGAPMLSDKCRSCILKATTASMFPHWERKD